MKKLSALFLTTVICLSCLVSCGASYTQNKYFSDEMLIPNKLSDMPVPPHMNDSVMQAENILYLNLTNGEYESYVSDLLIYLRAKEDIYHLGYRVGSGLLAEMLPYSEIAPITDSYDVGDSFHQIFFSTEPGLANWNLLDTPIKITIIRESGKLEFKNYEYNTTISIYDGYRAQAMWNQCGAEHTYGEGIEYNIAGSGGTVTEYTCIHCGNTVLSDFIGDMKSYKVTIEDTDADHYIIDRRDSAISGVVVGFRTDKLIDADLKFLVNGTEISPRETEDGEWIYKFIMPCEDIVITTEIVGDSPAPVNRLPSQPGGRGG